MTMFKVKVINIDEEKMMNQDSGDNAVDICVDLGLLRDHLQRNGALYRRRQRVAGRVVAVQLPAAQGDHLGHCHLCLLCNESVFSFRITPAVLKHLSIHAKRFLMKRIRFGNLTHLVLVLTSKLSCYILLFFPPFRNSN